MQPTMCADITGSVHHPIIGIGAQGNSTKADTQAAPVAVTNKQSFVSDSGDLCLLQASRKL